MSMKKEKENLGQRLEHVPIVGCPKKGNTTLFAEERYVLRISAIR